MSQFDEDVNRVTSKYNHLSPPVEDLIRHCHPFAMWMDVVESVINEIQEVDDDEGGHVQDRYHECQVKTGKDVADEDTAEASIWYYHRKPLRSFLAIVLLYTSMEMVVEGSFGEKKGMENARPQKEDRMNKVIGTLTELSKNGWKSRAWSEGEARVRFVVKLRNHLLHEGPVWTEQFEKKIRDCVMDIPEIPGCSPEEKLSRLGRTTSSLYLIVPCRPPRNPGERAAATKSSQSDGSAMIQIPFNLVESLAAYVREIGLDMLLLPTSPSGFGAKPDNAGD